MKMIKKFWDWWSNTENELALMALVGVVFMIGMMIKILFI